jgi:hypothetical protein
MKVTGAAHMIGHLQSPCCGELCLAGMSRGCRHPYPDYSFTF